MKWIRWVLLMIQSGHNSVHRPTDGQGETSIPPFNFVEAWGYTGLGSNRICICNTNTNTNTAYLYLYLYLIKFQAMYLYLFLIHRIWCIWQIRFQIHFFPGMFSKQQFMEHKHTWIFCINMLKSAILFQNKCRGLIFLIPIGDCVCALDLACQWVCDKPLAELYWHRPLCNATWAS